MSLIAPYLATLLVFVGVDLVWLGYVAQGYYRSQIGHLMAEQLNLGAAVAFYLIYVAGIMIFAVQPAAASGGPMKGLLLGALFGFFCYATYDLTNLATLKNWSLPLSIVDTLWGAALTGLAACAGTWIAGKI